MALKPADALDAARNIWAGPRVFEAQRLNFIAGAVNPRRAYSQYSNQPVTAYGLGFPTVEMPKDAPQVMKNLAWKSRTNFLPLILDTFSQVMKADGYIEANGSSSKAWTYWQANGMDARQTGIHRSALQYGASYATVLPGDTGPVIEGISPRRMTAIYADPTIDDCCKALFGLTPDEAEAVERPDDWDWIETKPIVRQVIAFDAAGWDVTDNKRRPLRVLIWFNQPLWLAIRGVAGDLPFRAEATPDLAVKSDPWGAQIAAEAAKFAKR